jgi:hypothetical protein
MNKQKSRKKVEKRAKESGGKSVEMMMMVAKANDW